MLIRKTLLIVMLLTIGSGNVLIGCNSLDQLMDEKDKEPRMEVFAYDFAGNLLATPVMYYTVEWWDGSVKWPCDQPKGYLRFDMFVESYDINQPFDIQVVWPTDDIDLIQHFDPAERPSVILWPQTTTQMPIAWPTIPKTFTSDNGRGPGGFFSLTVGTWAPAGGQAVWAYGHNNVTFFNWDLDNPHFVQPEIVFILTDSEGRKVVRKMKVWVNVIQVGDSCP